jgi:hypothetical protein
VNKMKIHIRLWSNPDKTRYSRITPKRKAPLAQNRSGGWEWIWHEAILNQIQFCAICNWQREDHSRRPKHLMELIGNSAGRFNMRHCRTNQRERTRYHSKSS